MARSRAGIALSCLLAVVAACADGGEGDPDRPASTKTSPLAMAFQASAVKAGVPRDLLVAIAKVEDGLAVPAMRPDIDEDNEVPAAGPLQLRRGKLDTLRRGAELASLTERDLRVSADLALAAGALVLAELGARTGARPLDLASWAAAIEEMGGFADAAHREKYVHDVFAVLARGGSFVGRDGETVELAPHDLPPSLTVDVDTSLHALAVAEFPNTEWIPTSCASKCNPSRNGARVDLVVIHDTEGNWNASVATLQNDPNKSTHYIVGEDGRVAQFVTEETTAWHAGNSHYNQRSIGIEHVGYATKPFPEPLYAASARLVGHLLAKYGIPRDRAHVIGHDQVPDGPQIGQTAAPCLLSPRECQRSASYGGSSNHTDPGIWEWATYMVRFGGTSKCNDVTAIRNCSKDERKAFRCVGGNVEVESCDGGCEVMPIGVDDVCHVTPKPGTPPVLPPLEPDEEEEDDRPPVGPSGAPPKPPPSSSGGLLAEPGPARADTDDAGCALGARSSRTGSPCFTLLGAALLLGLRRRKGPLAGS